MRSPISGATCSGHKLRKRLFLCVFVWLVIFFVSGTLFVKRRYGITEELASLSSSLQDQIDKLSITVNEHKTSAQNIIKGLHKEMNMTMAMFGERMQELRLEIKQRQQKAVDALRALHGYQLKVAAPATVMSTSLPRSDLRPNASVESCVDSMEKPVGSAVELFGCHSEGGNQAWTLTADGRIKNNKLNFCLRSSDVSDGGSVITAHCHENDGLQKWRLSNHLLAVDEYSDRCLEADLTHQKLVTKLCDSKNLSQHWLV